MNVLGRDMYLDSHRRAGLTGRTPRLDDLAQQRLERVFGNDIEINPACLATGRIPDRSCSGGARKGA
ncbi:MAG: hypothetical protein WBM40_01455 [Thiohalocapsa sp.]